MKPTKAAVEALIEELRGIAPKRPLTYAESLQVARRQAARLRRWVGSDRTDINLLWLLEQTVVPVHLVPSHRLGEESGATTNAIGGRLQIFLNQNDNPQRLRFSLLHEMKHWIDFRDADVLHSKLGRGDAKLRDQMIEWIANEFAGQVLMPTMLVKRAWYRCQDIRTVANIFNVSVEAMATRLERLNLIGKPKARPRVYFRRRAALYRAEQVLTPAAA